MLCGGPVHPCCCFGAQGVGVALGQPRPCCCWVPCMLVVLAVRQAVCVLQAVWVQDCMVMPVGVVWAQGVHNPPSAHMQHFTPGPNNSTVLLHMHHQVVYTCRQLAGWVITRFCGWLGPKASSRQHDRQQQHGTHSYSVLVHVTGVLHPGGPAASAMAWA